VAANQAKDSAYQELTADFAQEVKRGSTDIGDFCSKSVVAA